MHLRSLTLKYRSHAKRWGWIAAVCLATSTTLSGLDLDPILVGAWLPHPSDHAQDVVLSGDYAYVAAGGSGLWVIDVSRPDRPWRVGHVDTTGHAQSVFVQGQYAYLAQSHSQSGLNDVLVVIDVADPTNPRQVGSFSRSSSEGNGHDVEVAGDFAYLADGAEGLQIIDVTDPTRPKGVVNVLTAGSVTGLAVAGDYVYLAASAQLITIKISPPTQPQWLGDYPLPEWLDDVAVLGNYAYVAIKGPGNNHRLGVMDLNDPASPTLLREYLVALFGIGGWNERITAVDNRVFLNGAVVDVTDPLNPRKISYLRGQGFTAAGDYVYVAAGEAGLKIFNLANPANPQRLGSVEELGNAVRVEEVAPAGDFAVAACITPVHLVSELHVIDTRDPAAFVPLGMTTLDGQVRAIAISGGHAYVTGYSVGLQVFDLQNPASPRKAGYCPLEGERWRIRIAGDYAYLRGRDDGPLSIIDIRNPSAPRRVGQWSSLDADSDNGGMVLVGDRLYLEIWRGMLVLDIANPLQPTLLARYDAGNRCFGVAIAGDYAYLATEAGLEVIDISDPGNPRWTAAAPLRDGESLINWWPGQGADVVVAGHYVYVSSPYSASPGLHVFDVRDPANPKRVGGNSGPSLIYRLTLDGGRLYAGGTVGYGSAVLVFDLYRPPLRLDPPESLGADGWRLRLWGAPGQPLRLQRSLDLHIWEDWQSTTGTDLPQEFIDDHAGSRPRQFYRAVSP
jgi:hypothetical protein